MLRLPAFRWRTAAHTATATRTRGAHVPRAIAVMLVVYLLANLSLGWAIKTERIQIRDALYTSQLKALQAIPAFWQPCDKPKFVMLGSSRAQQGFNPSIFMQKCDSETYNFAIPGAGCMANGLYLRRLFEMGLKTDYVLIEWHPGFTAAPAKNGLILENGWLFDNRILDHEYPILNAWGNPRGNPQPNRTLWYANTLNQFRLELVNKYFPTLQVVPLVVVRNEDERIRGYCKGFPYDPAKYQTNFDSSQRSYRPIYEEYRVGHPGWNAMLDMIAIAKQNGATPIVVWSPECPDVQALYGPQGNEDLRKAFDGLNCLKINARDWIVKEQTADGHHLTEAGAMVFTTRLADAVKVMVKP